MAHKIGQGDSVCVYKDVYNKQNDLLQKVKVKHVSKDVKEICTQILVEHRRENTYNRCTTKKTSILFKRNQNLLESMLIAQTIS